MRLSIPRPLPGKALSSPRPLPAEPRSLSWPHPARRVRAVGMQQAGSGFCTMLLSGTHSTSGRGEEPDRFTKEKWLGTTGVYLD